MWQGKPPGHYPVTPAENADIPDRPSTQRGAGPEEAMEYNRGFCGAYPEEACFVGHDCGDPVPRSARQWRREGFGCRLDALGPSFRDMPTEPHKRNMGEKLIAMSTPKGLELGMGYLEPGGERDPRMLSVCWRADLRWRSPTTWCNSSRGSSSAILLTGGRGHGVAADGGALVASRPALEWRPEP